jgi:membrane-associated phospholipid phosphatase
MSWSPALVARGVGEMAVVEGLPTVVVDLFGLLTRLGDPVTLLLVVLTGYLLATHLGVSSTRMATALALTLGGFALTLALKHAFALPRPPGAGTDGYGFPSGHALGATVVYGGMAVLVDDRRLSLAAAGLVVVVAASRVAIGVHYLVDVVAGVVAGGCFLAAALRLGPGRAPARVTPAHVHRTFALAAAVGLVALATAVGTETAVAVAATLGAWLGWRLAADRVVDAPGSARRLAISVVAVPVVGGVAVVALDGVASLPVAAGLVAAVAALVVALPRLTATA